MDDRTKGVEARDLLKAARKRLGVTSSSSLLAQEAAFYAAITEALRERNGLSEGFVLAPRQATPEMEEAGARTWDACPPQVGPVEAMGLAYGAMIAALSQEPE